MLKKQNLTIFSIKKADSDMLPTRWCHCQTGDTVIALLWKKQSKNTSTLIPAEVMQPWTRGQRIQLYWSFIGVQSQFHFEGSHMQLGVMNVLLNYIHLCKFSVPIEIFCGNIVALTNGVSFAMWLNPFSAEQLAVISVAMSSATVRVGWGCAGVGATVLSWQAKEKRALDRRAE